MKVTTKIVRIAKSNIDRTHLIIQNLTDSNLYLLPHESSEKEDYINNGACFKLNGLFEDFGRFKGGIYGYADVESDIRVLDL